MIDSALLVALIEDKVLVDGGFAGAGKHRQLIACLLVVVLLKGQDHFILFYD